LLTFWPPLPPEREGGRRASLRDEYDFDAVVISGITKRRRRKCGGARLDRRERFERGGERRFSRQKAVGIFSRDWTVAILMPASSRVFRREVRRPSPAFRPAKIHAEKDGGPILRFGAAAPGLMVMMALRWVGFAGGSVLVSSSRCKYRRGEFFVEFPSADHFFCSTLVSCLARSCRFRYRWRWRWFFRPAGNFVLRRACVAENSLSGFLVCPKIGGRGADFESFQALAGTEARQR